MPNSFRGHPVFHVSDLQTYSDPNPNSKLSRPMPIQLEDGSHEFEVEKLTKKRKWKNKFEYLARFKGFHHTHDRWLPLSELQHCLDLVKAFDEQERQSAAAPPEKKKTRRKKRT